MADLVRHCRPTGTAYSSFYLRSKTNQFQVPNGGLTTFNTLIISGLGFNPLQTSLLAMPPGAMSTISGIALSYVASTTRRYRTHLVAGSILLPLLGALLCYNLSRDNLAGQLVGL